MGRSPVLVTAVVLAAFSAAIGGTRPQATDLDRFMAEVLARRDDNWNKLQQYLLDERERVQVFGPDGLAMWGDDRTYTWFIREGFFVRSPVAANGVTIPDDDRRQAEHEYLQRARARDRGGMPAVPPPGEPTPEPETRDVRPGLGGLLSQSRAPQFVDNAYFLRFKFEAGTYALAGRENLNGTEVYRIEYYPTRLFSHEQEAQDRRAREGRRERREDVEAARERMMNKASLVTLWVEPRARQIVKYTFDNVALDFLPAAWLLRVDNLQAAMTMAEAFPGVWLPREITFHFGAMIAAGPLDVRYHVTYEHYRKATSEGRLVPLGPR